MKRFWTPSRVKVGKGVGGISCTVCCLFKMFWEYFYIVSTLFKICWEYFWSLSCTICMLPETQWVLLFRNRPNHLFTSSSLLSWVGRVLGLIFNSHPVEEISFAITGDPLIIPLSLSQLPASLKLSERTWKVDSAGQEDTSSVLEQFKRWDLQRGGFDVGVALGVDVTWGGLGWGWFR